MQYIAFLTFLAAVVAAKPINDAVLRAEAVPVWSVTNFKINSHHLGEAENQWGLIHYEMHVTGSNSSAQCDVATDSDALTMCDKYEVPQGFSPHGCDGTTLSPWSWTLNRSESVTQPQREVLVLRVAYDAPGQYPRFGCTEVDINQTCTEDGCLVIDVPSTFTLTTQTSDECIFA